MKMRLQLALNVSDLDEAIDFYTKAFGTEVNKRKPGYANFAIDEPPLKLVLFEATEGTERLNHLGVEVFDDSKVDEATDRLRETGIDHEAQKGTCCFARQNKVIAYDPDGTMWEWYRVLEDSETFFARSAVEESGPAVSAKEETSGCCS